MGAKTSEDDYQDHNGGGGPSSSGPSGAGGEPRGVHLSRDGDGSLGNNGGGDDEDGDDSIHQSGSVPLTIGDGGNKKKKLKKKKKKKKKATQATPTKQSSPPRVPLSDLYPSGEYSPGEFLDYPDGSRETNTARTTGAERRYLDRNHLEDPALLNDYRKAAEVHRQVRHWVQDTVKPGDTLLEIATGIEDSVRALLGNQAIEPGDGLKSGMGFPTGLSLNHEVAHYTPNPGQKEIVLKQKDVMKVDYGVQINGWIVDSAFTMSFDPVYDNLLAGVKDATESGIRAAGIDVRICDVSSAIQETMESYEVEISGKTYPVKPVRSLCAHDIKRYLIHGSKSIPFTKNNDQTKMEEGEIFAIETFGSTGRGKTYEDNGVYGYGLRPEAPQTVALPFATATRLHKVIKEQFGTIVFCRRYLDRLGLDRYLAGLNCLVSHGVLDMHLPLADIKGSYSAQFEHTILLRESNKEVLSRGSDY